MAKFKFEQNIADNFDFNGDTDLHVNKKGTQAVWTAIESNVTMELEGSGFKVSGNNEDFLSAGKIESIVIKDGDGDVVVNVTGMNVKAKQLVAAFEDGGAEGVAFFLAKGDDVIVGSKHSDYIIGAAGDDIMTGKGGSDYFIFKGYGGVPAKAAPEHDVITDFDITGNDADRLQLYEDYKLVNKGDDTLMKFEDGSTLLLEHIKKADMQDYLDSIVS